MTQRAEDNPQVRSRVGSATGMMGKGNEKAGQRTANGEGFPDGARGYQGSGGERRNAETQHDSRFSFLVCVEPREREAS